MSPSPSRFLTDPRSSLNNLVRAGKVLYLGISDTPAWVVSKANEYARAHALAPFVVYQGRWSAVARDLERDLLPMCRAEGMGIAPWGVVGQGRFHAASDRGKAKEGRSKDAMTEKDLAASDALEQVAIEMGGAGMPRVGVTTVAIAYVLAKYPWVFPIIGGRKVEHLEANIAALDVHLSRDQVRQIDAAIPFEYGEPMSMVSAEEGGEVG